MNQTQDSDGVKGTKASKNLKGLAEFKQVKAEVDKETVMAGGMIVPSKSQGLAESTGITIPAGSLASTGSPGPYPWHKEVVCKGYREDLLSLLV